MSLGTLFVIAAPSGAGKTSLIKALLAEMDGIGVSVSHTTRRPRPGEEDGLHYHFVTVDAFRAMIGRQEFVEHAEVYGNFYGTSKGSLQTLLDQGRDVILEIDWQGARQVRAQFPECISVSILPPSRQTLEERLSARGQDDTEVIARRMTQAIEEISHYEEFDYLIINDNFESALQELQAVILGQRLRLEAQRIRWKDLLDQLLA